jgi:hypothetical protein
LPPGIEAIPASVQDRDGAADLIKKTRRLFPFDRHVFAVGGYSGDSLAAGLAAQRVTSEIVERTDKRGGFKLIRGAGLSSAPSPRSDATAA